MRTETITYNIYQFNELNAAAKERVRQRFLNDEVRNDEFCENCQTYLNQHFPRSDLKPHYSLSSCQGDGFNIEGTVDFFDVFEEIKEKFTEEETNLLESYFNNSKPEFKFTVNRRYGYSCKFIDKKYIDDYVDTVAEDLISWSIKANPQLLKEFFIEMLDYFEELDKKFEKDGYDYLYNISDEEVDEICAANDYEFLEDGTLYY